MYAMIVLSWVLFIPWYDIGDIMTGATWGAGHNYSSGAHDFNSGFHRCSCCPVICVSFCYVIVLSFGFEFGCSFALIAWYFYIFTFIETRLRSTRKKLFWSLPSFDTPLLCLSFDCFSCLIAWYLYIFYLEFSTNKKYF